MTMDNKNDKIFSSIYPRPQADHQGGQIARDHLMSNLRDHYLGWDAMIFGLAIRFSTLGRDS